MTEADRTWMDRALALAERGRGAVEPNPLVGAVVVREGQCVGEGWHERYGEAHAEVHALKAAGEAARGATLYVTLEPCCHHGKTPPCTDAVLAAGIQRVVAAMADPFPAVAGKGAELLRAAGLTVELGLGESEARRLNAPYLKLLGMGRPYVHAKWAMSLDGKIATAAGQAKWISSAASRQWVHALRGQMDAIIIGSGTARADDPSLTVRPPGPRTPVRIVLGHPAALTPTCQLVQTARQVPVLLVTTPSGEASQMDHLRQAGVEVVGLASEDRVARVGELLDELGRRRMTNVLVEGGSAVLGSFHDARALDEIHVFIAPILLGGARALTSLAGLGVSRIEDATPLKEWQVEQIGPDLVLHGRLGSVAPRPARVFQGGRQTGLT
jgi:diaminohydroxyphosphoribosylaminopyrimidine deaminase/5-amino-6-(5-phosphoribosylamino)uracil reductase